MSKTVQEAAAAKAKSVDGWEERTAIAWCQDMLDMEKGSAFSKFSYIRLANIYLVSCCLYYEHNMYVLSDGKFDKLCEYLLEHHDMLEISGVMHVDKNITVDNLLAGTCLGVDYPVPIRTIAAIIDRIVKDSMRSKKPPPPSSADEEVKLDDIL